MRTTVTRFDLQQINGITPKLVQFFEQLFAASEANTSAIGAGAEGTRALQDATVLTLSSNDAFGNERILTFDTTHFVVSDGGAGGQLLVELVNLIALNGGFQCTFNLEADTNIDLPSQGRIPSSADGPFADDAAAAAAGVEVGEWYARPAGVLAWRVS